MSNMLKCPNPSCPYVFDPSQVPVGVVLSCPRCGMQFTLGPPAAANTAPPPNHPSGPSYPTGPTGYGAPSAPQQEQVNPELEEVGRTALEDRDPDAPLPGRRTNKAQVFILAGIAAVLMAGTALAIIFKLMHRPEAETGDGLTKIPDINIGIGTLPEEWKHDDTKKNEFGSPYVRSYRRTNPEAYLVLGANEPGKNVKRMPLPSELHRGLRKPLPKIFDMSSLQELDPLETKWLDQAIAPEHGFKFRAQSQDGLPWIGEAYAVAYKGFAYYWISWCGEADFEKLQPEFAAIRSKFKLLDAREGWTPSGVISTDYKGDKVPYTLSDATLSDTEQTWKEIRTDEYPALKAAEPDLDRRLRMSYTPQGDRKARPDTAELSVFILDGSGDPLQVARKYVEDRETARIRAANAEFAPPTFKERTDPPEGDPIATDVPATTPVVRLESNVKDSRDAARLIVASGLKVGDKIVVVECWCEFSRRRVFETKFIQIASSLR